MSEDQPAGRDEVEVAHEALIRHWPRLRDWLETDRATLLLREGVREAAQEWAGRGRDESYLAHRGRRLEEAAALRDHPRITLNSQERAYLDAALALRAREEEEREAQRQWELAAQRERAELAEAARREAEQRVSEQAVAARRLRRRFLVAAGLGAIAVAAALAAFSGFQQAGDQRDRAEEQRGTAVAAAGTAEAERIRADVERNHALSRQLQAQSRDLAAEEFDLALLLSLEADRLVDTAEAKVNVLTVLQANPRFRQYLPVDDTPVGGLALSPDGRTLVSTSESGAIRLWDLATGTSRVISERRLTRTRNPAFSADGRTLAVSGCSQSDESEICERGQVILLDANSGQERAQLDCPSIPGDVALSPDGVHVFATCGFALYWWDLSRGAGGQLRDHVERRSDVAVSPHPDSPFMASSWAIGIDVTLLNLETGVQQKLERPLPRPPELTVEASEFSPDGKMLAVAYSDATISLWDTASGTPTERSLSATRRVLELGFSPDGTTIGGVAFDGTLLVWDVQTGRMLGTPIRGHRGGITSFALGTNGTLTTGGTDGRLALWDIGAEQRMGRTLFEAQTDVSDAAFSPDGRKLAVATTEISNGDLWDLTYGISIWDVTSRQQLNVDFAPPHGLSPPSFAPECLAFAPDGKTLAAGMSNGSIVRWDVETGRQKGEVLARTEDWFISIGGCTLAFSPNGQLLAFGSILHDVTLWDATSRQRRIQSLATPRLKRVLFSSDSERLLTLGSTALLWDVTANPASSQTVETERGGVLDGAFSSGQLLFTVSDDGTLWRADVGEGSPTFTLLASPNADPDHIAVSPDAKLLAFGAQEGAVQLLDAATGLAIAELTGGHLFRPQGLAFSPDGRWLVSWATSTSSPPLMVWDVSFASWQAQACALARRNLTPEEWRRFVGPDVPYERTCPKLSSGDGASTATAATPIATPGSASAHGQGTRGETMKPL